MKQYRVVAQLRETVPNGGSYEVSRVMVGPMDYESAKAFAAQQSDTRICDIADEYRFLYCWIEEHSLLSVEEFLAWKEQISAS